MVVRAGRDRRWLGVVAAGVGWVAPQDLAGEAVHVPLGSVRPDRLSPGLLLAGVAGSGVIGRRGSAPPAVRDRVGLADGRHPGA